MKIYLMEQGTPEWIAIRKGKLTASSAQAIASNGKGLQTLCYEILAEKYSTNTEPAYINDDMIRGQVLEEQARQIFELEIGEKIQKVGFVEMDEYVGASPDGFIGEDGLIEIKCKKDSTYFRAIVDNEIDSQYLWQIQMQLLVTGRKFCSFVDYNPNFVKSINITKILPDKEMQDKIIKGLESGKKLLKELEAKYLKLIS